MRIRYLTLLCFGLFASAQAGAQGWEPRLYAGLGGGKFSLDNSKFYNFSESSTAWDIFFGFEFNRYIAVEAGRMDAGTPTLTTCDCTVSPPDIFDDTISVPAWHASAIGSFPFNDTISIYGRLGLRNTHTKVQQKFNGITYYTSSNTATDPVLGLGFAVNVDTGMLRLEYDISKLDAKALSPTTGAPTTYTFDNSYISLSVAWKFGF